MAYVVRINPAPAGLENLQKKLRQQQNGDTMEPNITEHPLAHEATDNNTDNLIDETSGAALSSHHDSSTGRDTSDSNDKGNQSPATTVSVASSNLSSVNSSQHSPAGKSAIHPGQSIEATRYLGENDDRYLQGNGSIPRQHQEPFKNVLENTISHYQNNKLSWWYAGHINKLKNLLSTLNGETISAEGSTQKQIKLHDIKFHFTDGLIHPQTLIGGFFSKGTLWSKTERTGSWEAALQATPIEILSALAIKRQIIKPEHKLSLEQLTMKKAALPVLLLLGILVEKAMLEILL